jgi:hypothetical protein
MRCRREEEPEVRRRVGRLGKRRWVGRLGEHRRVGKACGAVALAERMGNGRSLEGLGCVSFPRSVGDGWRAQIGCLCFDR